MNSNDAFAGDPVQRMQFAPECAKESRYAEALGEFLWCFDHGIEEDEAFVGVHDSFLISDILELGKVYPPARQALIARRDECLRRLRSGDAMDQDAYDLVAINKRLKQQEVSVALFDSLPPQNKMRAILGWGIRGHLLEERQYVELLRIFHPETELAKQIESLGCLSSAKGARSRLEEMLLRNCCPLVEALAGTGEHQRASELADGICRIVPKRNVVIRLVEHAERAGDLPLAQYLKRKI